MQNPVFYYEQTEGIKEPVRIVRERPLEYASELDAQTQEYLRLLRDFEMRCSRAGADREALQTEIAQITDAMVDACADYERCASDPFEVKAAQVMFRERTNDMLSKSYCMNRARTWPQGHQGDYHTLEMAYKNTPLSEGIGYFLDRYLLSSPLGHGVRERITRLRDLVRAELAARRGPRVLDVACGSCREVFELAPDIKASGARFTCVDLDEDALDYALDRFALAGLSDDEVELRKYNALRIFDFEMAEMEFGKQDVIYSVGYFDYLPDDFLAKLLGSLYRLLTPGGKLIAAFKDASRYKPQLYHWLVNWDGFLQRTEPDFERLFEYAQIPAKALTIERVPSGTILFYTAVKE